MSEQIAEGRFAQLVASCDFRLYALDADGTLNYFETDQAETDTPTLTIGGREPVRFSKAHLWLMHYFLANTNAVTHQLFLYGAAYADDITSRLRRIWESATGQARNTHYYYELARPFTMFTGGVVLYSIDYSGASGNTPAFLELLGTVEA